MPLDEVAYEHGNRAAWTRILTEARKQLGYEHSEARASRWIVERERAIAALREVCADFGDNEWPDNLDLGDIINKHLHDHLAGPKPCQ